MPSVANNQGNLETFIDSEGSLNYLIALFIFSKFSCSIDTEVAS